MRKVTLLAALVAALLMVTAGVAVAESLEGNGGNNTLRGSSDRDRIDGFGGNDNIYGFRGKDILFGNRGDDNIYAGDGRDRVDGGRGDDFIFVQGDDRPDRVQCGSGRDVVKANPEDNLAGDCEVEKAIGF